MINLSSLDNRVVAIISDRLNIPLKLARYEAPHPAL